MILKLHYKLWHELYSLSLWVFYVLKSCWRRSNVYAINTNTKVKVCFLEVLCPIISLICGLRPERITKGNNDEQVFVLHAPMASSFYWFVSCDEGLILAYEHFLKYPANHWRLSTNLSYPSSETDIQILAHAAADNIKF